jgi:hypothetical protein
MVPDLFVLIHLLGFKFHTDRLDQARRLCALRCMDARRKWFHCGEQIWNMRDCERRIAFVNNGTTCHLTPFPACA